MKIKVWPSDEAKARGDEPYKFEIRKPTFEEIKMCMREVEREGKVGGGEKLFYSLVQSCDDEIKNDPNMFLEACLQVYINSFQGGVSEIEGESSGIESS